MASQKISWLVWAGEGRLEARHHDRFAKQEQLFFPVLVNNIKSYFVQLRPLIRQLG